MTNVFSSSSHMMRSARLSVYLLCLCAIGTPLGPVHAQGSTDVAGAARAYSRAQQAEIRRDFAEAANLYALADEMSPTPEALRSAARAAQRAGLEALAATHAATLLKREGSDAQSRTVAEDILRTSEGKLARVDARCSVPCRLLLEGRIASNRLDTEHLIYARPGVRRISASFETGEPTEELSLRLVAGQKVDISLTQPPPPVSVVPVETQEAESKGLSPWYFGSAAALTGVAGALTIWSSLKVRSAHSEYDRTADNAVSRYREGQRLETRTNTFLGVTSGLAVTAAVLAVFTEWGNTKGEVRPQATGRKPLPSLAADSRGVWVGLTGAL